MADVINQTPSSTTTTTTKTNTNTNAKDTQGSNRRPLAKGRVYHFNVIYNHARCPLSVTADTALSLAWTQWAVERLQLTGLVNSYYHDRDGVKGQGLLQELARVIAGSEVTLVLLTPGFVRDCWPRYWFFSCFKSLFSLDQPPAEAASSTSSSHPSSSSTGISSPRYSSSSRSPPTASGVSSPRYATSPRPLSYSSSTSSYSSSTPSYSSLSLYSTSGSTSPRTPPGGGGSPCSVVVVAVGVGEGELPAGLRSEDVLFFSKDWQQDLGAWGRLEGSINSALGKARVDQDLKIDAKQTDSPRSTGSRSRTPREQDDVYKQLSPRTSDVTSSGYSSPRRREDKTDVTSDAHKSSSYTSNGDTSPRSKKGKYDASYSDSSTENSSYRHSYPSYSDGANKTGSGSSSWSRDRLDFTGTTTNSVGTSNITTSPRLHGSSSPREHLSSQSLKLTATPLEMHGGFHTSTSQEELSSPRRVQGVDNRVEKLPALEKSAMIVERGPVATLVQSPASTTRESAGSESRPSEIIAMNIGKDKDNAASLGHPGSLNIDLNQNADFSQKQQLAKEAPGSSSAKTMYTTSPGGSDVESAILDRLGQAGIRRESLTTPPLTRVVVKGNTVSVDHIHASSPGRPQEERIACSKEQSSARLYGQATTDTSYFEEKNQKSKTENESIYSQSKERNLEDKGVFNISQNQTHPLDSFEGKARQSPGLNMTPESSVGTDGRDVPDSSSVTSKKQAMGVEAAATIESHSEVMKNQANASHKTVSRQEHSRSETRGLQYDDEVDHGFQDMQTAVINSAAPRDTAIDGTKNGSQQSAGLPSEVEKPAENVERTFSNTQQKPLPVSSPDISTNGKPQPSTSISDPRHLHDSVKLAIIEPNITGLVEPKHTAEQTSSTTDLHHGITSIEDDHDDSLTDYLSTSLTTSDYGTMSPRNELSSNGQGDSGFLSGGLSSFGENGSPRNSTPRSYGEEGTRVSVEVSKSPGTNTSLNSFQQAERGIPGDASVLNTSSLQLSRSSNKESLQSSSHDNNNSWRLSTQTKETVKSSHTFDQVHTLSSQKNTSAEPWMLTSQRDSTTSSSGRRLLGESDGARRERSDSGVTERGARVSRLGSDVDIAYVRARKDSWIYYDVDGKGWTLAELLFPLYRVMCYALSKPEMPYF